MLHKEAATAFDSVKMSKYIDFWYVILWLTASAIGINAEGH